jgi:hypothetical protein
MSFESFKAGFAKQCVESGIDPIVALDAALARKEAVVGEVLKGVGGAIGSLGAWGIPLAFGGAAATGGALGAAASGVQEMGEDDVEDVRRREMINNYRQLAREMEMRAKNRPQPQFKARSPIMR